MWWKRGLTCIYGKLNPISFITIKKWFLWHDINDCNDDDNDHVGT